MLKKLKEFRIFEEFFAESDKHIFMHKKSFGYESSDMKRI